MVFEINAICKVLNSLYHSHDCCSRPYLNSFRLILILSLIKVCILLQHPSFDAYICISSCLCGVPLHKLSVAEIDKKIAHIRRTKKHHYILCIKLQSSKRNTCSDCKNITKKKFISGQWKIAFQIIIFQKVLFRILSYYKLIDFKRKTSY